MRRQEKIEQPPEKECATAQSSTAAWLQGSPIFTLGGNATADVPLRLVFFQDLLDLKIQCPVVKGQTFLDILMYRGLTDTEFLCRVSHGGAVFDNVGGQFTGALLDISFQDPTRSLSRYTGVYAWG